MTRKGTSRLDADLLNMDPGAYMPDRGCSLHPSCLSCPLPRCRYDGEPGWMSLEATADRYEEIRHLYKIATPIAEIARQLGVGERVVYRATRQLRAGVPHG